MVQEVRAVYEKGRLRVLDPITLAEGEQVQVRIFSAQERTLAALGDLLIAIEPDAGDAGDPRFWPRSMPLCMEGFPFLRRSSRNGRRVPDALFPRQQCRRQALRAGGRDSLSARWPCPTPAIRC